MVGYFNYEDKTIFYSITDNWSEKPKVIHGIEKIGRFLNYYDAQGNSLGLFRVYDEYDKLQNISAVDAEMYYIKMLNQKHNR